MQLESVAPIHQKTLIFQNILHPDGWMTKLLWFSTTPEVLRRPDWPLPNISYWGEVFQQIKTVACLWKNLTGMFPQQGAVQLFFQVPRRCEGPPETLCVPCILCGQESDLSFLLLLLYHDSPRLFHFGEKILDWFELLLLLLGIFVFSPLPGQRETRQTSQANFVGKLM